MNLAAVGRGFGGTAPEIDGAIEFSIGIVDGGHPGEGFGVMGVAIETLLGEVLELAEVFLLEEGFAIGGKGEGGER